MLVLTPPQKSFFIILVSLFVITGILIIWQVQRTKAERLQHLSQSLANILNDTTLFNEPTLIVNSYSKANPVLSTETSSPVPVTATTSVIPTTSPVATSSPIPTPSAIANATARPVPSPSSLSTFTPSDAPIAPTNTAPTSPTTPIPTENLDTPAPPIVSSVTPPTSSPITTADYWATVQKQLSDYLNQDSSINWSISVRNAKGDQEYISIGDTPTFIAASTTKLLTAAAFLTGVQKGTYSLDQQIGAFPADFQLDELVNQSDNDSWDLINQTVGSTALEHYAHDIGVKSFNYANNTVDPHEMTKMLTDLYQQKLLDSHYTSQLLGYMQHTEEERFLPPSVPAADKVFHKVGLLEDKVHDVGIVDNGSQSYSVAIYSNGNGIQNYDERALKFAQIGSILFKNQAP